MCKKILIALFATAFATATVADEIPAPEWKLSLAFGQGVLENPLAEHADGESYLLPSFSYYGERFFVSNLTVGYSLLEERNFYLDLVARPNEDGIFYKLDSSSVTNGALSSFLPHFAAVSVGEIDRDVSVVAGPSATLVGDYVDLSFSWFHDVTGVHDGSEAHLSLDKQYPLLGGSLGFSVGAVNKDADLVNYYYHYTAEEGGIFAQRFGNSHPPDDVTDQYARLYFSYPLGKQFDLLLAARYNRFDLDGRNPRFIENKETLNWFAGLQYTIGGGK